jgi:hypothetical protein
LNYIFLDFNKITGPNSLTYINEILGTNFDKMQHENLSKDKTYFEKDKTYFEKYKKVKEMLETNLKLNNVIDKQCNSFYFTLCSYF